MLSVVYGLGFNKLEGPNSMKGGGCANILGMELAAQKTLLYVYSVFSSDSLKEFSASSTNTFSIKTLVFLDISHLSISY